MQQESGVHGSLAHHQPSAQTAGIHIHANPTAQPPEIRPDISQNKLYGNAFQACKTWQERWLLTLHSESFSQL